MKPGAQILTGGTIGRKSVIGAGNVLMQDLLPIGRYPYRAKTGPEKRR